MKVSVDVEKIGFQIESDPPPTRSKKATEPNVR